MSCDLVIPLGVGSKSDNDELRILLRSAERNAIGLGRVIIPTQAPPKWLRNAIVVSCGDPLQHNKDGNLINKVLTALVREKVTGDFILAADDNVFCQPVNVSEIPMLYNTKGIGDFDPKGNRWRVRMLNTMEYLIGQGWPSDRNYETHTPQVFNAQKVLTGMQGIDYVSEPGFGIYSLFRCVSGEFPNVTQNKCKTTHENVASADAPIDRMFAGYNDSAFLNGLRERLFEMFPDKSRFEE